MCQDYPIHTLLLDENEMTSPLVTTKLYIPPLRPELVPRPRLIERLDEGVRQDRKLTLVSAPAGFGKTTCVSEWVNALNVPVSWLSLDPTNDDPGRFFRGREKVVILPIQWYNHC